MSKKKKKNIIIYKSPVIKLRDRERERERNKETKRKAKSMTREKK